jgi:hypothetical protein
MDEKLKRLWFQFRLSTWFVLLAILGWTMYFGLPFGAQYWNDANGITTHGGFGRLPLNQRGEPGYWTIPVFTSATSRYKLIFYIYHIGLPALVLAALLAWKATWAMVERRRRKAA